MCFFPEDCIKTERHCAHVFCAGEVKLRNVGEVCMKIRSSKCSWQEWEIDQDKWRFTSQWNNWIFLQFWNKQNGIFFGFGKIVLSLGDRKSISTWRVTFQKDWSCVQIEKLTLTRTVVDFSGERLTYTTRALISVKAARVSKQVSVPIFDTSTDHKGATMMANSLDLQWVCKLSIDVE